MACVIIIHEAGRCINEEWIVRSVIVASYYCDVWRKRENPDPDMLDGGSIGPEWSPFLHGNVIGAYRNNIQYVLCVCCRLCVYLSSRIDTHIGRSGAHCNRWTLAGDIIAVGHCNGMVQKTDKELVELGIYCKYASESIPRNLMAMDINWGTRRTDARGKGSTFPPSPLLLFHAKRPGQTMKLKKFFKIKRWKHFKRLPSVPVHRALCTTRPFGVFRALLCVYSIVRRWCNSSDAVGWCLYRVASFRFLFSSRQSVVIFLMTLICLTRTCVCSKRSVFFLSPAPFLFLVVVGGGSISFPVWHFLKVPGVPLSWLPTSASLILSVSFFILLLEAKL